jgi:hypothetical protein
MAAGILVLGVSASAVRGQEGDAKQVFASVFEHYEAVRLELLNDRFESLPAQGKALGELVASLGENFELPGSAEDSDEAVGAKEVASQLAAAAAALAAAEDIEAARTAFYELTKPLLVYRQLFPEGAPAEAYCPMAGKSWLQPEGEIGNPYYGQAMATCGAFAE